MEPLAGMVTAIARWGEPLHREAESAYCLPSIKDFKFHLTHLQRNLPPFERIALNGAGGAIKQTACGFRDASSSLNEWIGRLFVCYDGARL